MHFSLIYFTYLQDENKIWHFQKYHKNKIRKWNVEKPKTGFAIYKFQINPGPVFD